MNRNNIQQSGQRKKKKAPAKVQKVPKWYLQLNNVTAGSGAAPASKKSRARGTRNDVYNMTGTAPLEVNSSSPMANVYTVSQDELVGTINSSVTFQCDSYSWQPGLALYPWVSQVAKLYQRYRIRRTQFYFRPIVSQYDPLGARGRLVLSFDYDAAGQTFSNLQQAESVNPNVIGLAYENLQLTLDPRRCTGTDGKFVRVGNPPAGTDIKTYDSGSLLVSREGFSGVGAIGELRVKYDIDFLNPILPGSVAPTINNVISFWSGAAQAIVTGVDYTCSMPTVIYDGIDFSVTPTAFTCTSEGWYSLRAKVDFVPSLGTTYESVTFKWNGAVFGGSVYTHNHPGLSYTYTTVQFDCRLHLKVNDVINMTAYAIFAGTCNVLPSLQLTYI